MSVYASALHKMDALRDLVGYLDDTARRFLALSKDDRSEVPKTQAVSVAQAYEDAAKRLKIILDTRAAGDEPVADPPGLRLHIQPEEMCVIVALPGGRSVRLAAGQAPLFDAALEDRDRAVIRTLLAVAQNELPYNNTGGVQLPYPVAPTTPWNGGL